MNKTGLRAALFAALATITAGLAGAAPDTPRALAASHIQLQQDALQVGATATIAGGRVTYRVSLTNSGNVPLQDFYVAAGVPQGVTDVQPEGSPPGSWYRGVELGSAAWLLDQVPPGGTVGPFSYSARVLGVTPDPQQVFLHWLRPEDTIRITPPVMQTVAGIPEEITRIGGVQPGLGETWASFSVLPGGPIYWVYAGKVTAMEYQFSSQNMERGLSFEGLPGTAGLPDVDHVDLRYQGQGHEGFLFPHYDLRLYFVSRSETLAIGQ